jgi:hypothetical protein
MVAEPHNGDEDNGSQDGTHEGRIASLEHLGHILERDLGRYLAEIRAARDDIRTHREVLQLAVQEQLALHKQAVDHSIAQVLQLLEERLPKRRSKTTLVRGSKQ